jgi:hypothetical protein
MTDQSSVQAILRLRGGAAVARRAHNPKVAGSIPAPATVLHRLFFSGTI